MGMKPVKSTQGKHRTSIVFLKKKKKIKSREVQSLWQTVWRFLTQHTTKHTLAIQSSNCALPIYPKVVEKLCPCQNLHMDIYSSFIHNCQNLEAPEMSSSR